MGTLQECGREIIERLSPCEFCVTLVASGTFLKIAEELMSLGLIVSADSAYMLTTLYS
jgi:hypothetical protein